MNQSRNVKSNRNSKIANSEIACWLCRLARARGLASTAGDFEGVAGSLDWDSLLATADLHGVTELLRPALVAAGAAVPPHAIERVESRTVAVSALNLSRSAQLVRLMERLNARGVRALAFKGPTLSRTLYGDLARRASSDLDILVHPRQAAAVRPLLLEDGYMLPPRRRHRGGSLLHGLVPAAGRDDTLLPPAAPLAAVDVHVGFAYWTQGIRVDTGALFARAVTIDLLGTPVPTLCTDDLLIVLSIHGMMHGWCALRLLTDIDYLAPHVRDWDAAVDRAQSANALRVLSVALLLSHDVLETGIPEHILARASNDPATVQIVQSVRTRLFDPVLPGAGNWDPRPWFLSFQDDAWGRLRFHARDLIYEWFLKWPWDEWLGRRRHPGAVG